MSSTIVIDRVPLHFVAATTHARASGLAHRVRDAIAGSLPTSLAASCGPGFDADACCVFLDRLHVQCVVGAHWSDDAIADAFATRVAQALWRERHGEDSIVFTDRAEFVAAFIAALLEGHAFARWWYSEFDGLRALPLTACLRTLIETEPSVWQALARLSPGLARQAASTLSAVDADRVLASIERSASGARAGTSELLGAFEVGRRSLPSGPNRVVLSLIALERGASGAASARNLRLQRVLTKLVREARNGPPAAAACDERLMLMAWCDRAGLGQTERTLALELDADALRLHVAAAGASNAEEQVEGERQAASDSYTPHGGAVLLCVLLVKLGWWERWRDWLRRAGASRPDGLAAWLALAVAAQAADPRRSMHIEHDAVLHAVFGAPTREQLAKVDRFSRRLLAPALASMAAGEARALPGQLRPLLNAAARMLLARLGRRIPGCEGSTRAYLRSRCLRLPATVSEDGVSVRLGSAPLDVLLRLAGLKRADIVLPDGRTLVVREDKLQ